MAIDPILGPLMGLIFTMLDLMHLLSTLCLLLAVLVLCLVALMLPLMFAYAGLVKTRKSLGKCGEISVGVFHPYCDAGGGGERVLWVAIKSMATRFPSANFHVYTGDLGSAPDQILSRAESRFNLSGLQEQLSSRVEFVYLHRRSWVEAKKYPFFTLLGQSLGSVILGLEAFSHGVPTIFIDTMGYAFTLPLFRYFGGSRTACYVHYPTISTDMLDAVSVRRAAHNNRAFIANSRLATWAKMIYYRLFAWLYGWCGRCSDLTMVNSSWTSGHVCRIWFHGDDGAVHKIFPPCDTKELEDIVREGKDQDQKEVPFRILSLGQFRPEKDHALQIRTLARLRDALMEDPGGERQWAQVKLVLVGGVRNAGDEERVDDLKNLCRHLAVEDNVEFKVNIPFSELKSEMTNCTAGIHTMWNEHFGIAVVEMLAAGLLTVAHRSGGPLMDIVTESPEHSRNGFLAVNEEEYAMALWQMLSMTASARHSLIERARDSVRRRFSQREFETSWIRATECLFRDT